MIRALSADVSRQRYSWKPCVIQTYFSTDQNSEAGHGVTATWFTEGRCESKQSGASKLLVGRSVPRLNTACLAKFLRPARMDFCLRPRLHSDDESEESPPASASLLPSSGDSDVFLKESAFGSFNSGASGLVWPQVSPRRLRFRSSSSRLVLGCRSSRYTDFLWVALDAALLRCNGPSTRGCSHCFKSISEEDRYLIRYMFG